MAKKRTVRPFYSKEMQRLERHVRSRPDIKHTQQALNVIESVRRARMQQSTSKHG